MTDLFIFYKSHPECNAQNAHRQASNSSSLMCVNCLCRLQITWELNGCVAIWPQTTKSTSSHSRTLTPCTSMPLLTSSGQDWCSQTLIAHVTRYCGKGKGGLLWAEALTLVCRQKPLSSQTRITELTDNLRSYS